MSPVKRRPVKEIFTGFSIFRPLSRFVYLFSNCSKEIILAFSFSGIGHAAFV